MQTRLAWLVKKTWPSEVWGPVAVPGIHITSIGPEENRSKLNLYSNHHSWPTVTVATLFAASDSARQRRLSTIALAAG